MVSSLDWLVMQAISVIHIGIYNYVILIIQFLLVAALMTSKEQTAAWN